VFWNWPLPIQNAFRRSIKIPLEKNWDPYLFVFGLLCPEWHVVWNTYRGSHTKVYKIRLAYPDRLLIKTIIHEFFENSAKNGKERYCWLGWNGLITNFENRYHFGMLYSLEG